MMKGQLIQLLVFLVSIITYLIIINIRIGIDTSSCIIIMNYTSITFRRQSPPPAGGHAWGVVQGLCMACAGGCAGLCGYISCPRGVSRG